MPTIPFLKMKKVCHGDKNVQRQVVRNPEIKQKQRSPTPTWIILAG